MSGVHPVIAEIGNEDPEFLKVLSGIRKPVYSISEIVSDGLHGRTSTYKHIEDRLLVTFVSNGRRFSYAADYAKYLVAMKRIGETENRRHHLAKPENRPAHDPKHQRAA